MGPVARESSTGPLHLGEELVGKARAAGAGEGVQGPLGVLGPDLPARRLEWPCERSCDTGGHRRPRGPREEPDECACRQRLRVGRGTCDRCREGMYTLCQNYGKRETGHAHVGFTIGGGLAEYAAVPIAALHALPEHVTFEQGAWTDNLGVALWALERGRMAGGEHVVVIGPGAIGLCVAELARALGAGRVTLVGRGARLARVRDLADEVIDSADVTRLRGTADLVVEFAGTAEAVRAAIGLARRGGRVVLGGPTGTGVELSGVDLSTIVLGNLDILGSLANPKGVSGRALALLADAKVDVTSLVTHHFPLRSFTEAWQTFTERRGGAIRVMLHPAEGN